VIRRAGPADIGPWAALRHALWNLESEDSLAFQAGEALSKGPERFAAWMSFDGDQAVGFAEATVRHDYVNGCETSPVGFLEGVFVLPSHRGQGRARALIEQVEAWATALGMTELASDALLENAVGHAMHAAVGFEETERVVFYRKVLAPPDDPHRPTHPPPVA
jgi:aminoglycoside 6'-N-acetyltransferase I